MTPKSKKATALIVALLCVSISLMSTTAATATYSLSIMNEATAVGGGRCNDFLNGFAVGLGVAAFFGCIWCGGAAIASKAVETFAC
jgi:hypothetical protein